MNRTKLQHVHSGREQLLQFLLRFARPSHDEGRIHLLLELLEVEVRLVVRLLKHTARRLEAADENVERY